MNHIPSLSFKIRYEDLVEEPEECTRKTLSFLGLEDSEFCSSCSRLLRSGEIWKGSSQKRVEINH